MKILYVEDELPMNIERVLQLFEKTVLSERQSRELRDLQNDQYGATNDGIRAIIARSGVLDVETDFISALKKVEQNSEKYDLFIVDRQLATDTDAYKLEEVAAVIPEYTIREFEKYLTLEGDYLLMRLLRKGDRARCQMFYFLTAFTDTIQCQEDLRPFMEAGWLTAAQVLEKGNADHLQQLGAVIGQSSFLSVRYRHLALFQKVEALSKDPDTLARLVKFCVAGDGCKKENRSSILSDARGLLEDLVKSLCVQNNVPFDGRCREMLKALGPQPPDYERGKFVLSTSCRSLGITASHVCSDYGSMHPNDPVPDDVFHCALYAIRAFIAMMPAGDPAP